MRRNARELKSISDYLSCTKEALEDMIQNEGESILTLATKLKSQTTLDGEYSEIEQHEIDDIIHNLTPYTSNTTNLPSLYDPEETQRIIEKLDELHERCFNISNHLIEAANEMEKTDETAAAGITGVIGSILTD